MSGIAIKRNDFVVVTAGKEKGKKGKVLRVLRDKDRVIVEKVNFIKRLVGLPGDTITYRDKHLYVNGEEVSLNNQMIAEGHAWNYDGGTKNKDFNTLKEIRVAKGTWTEA